MQASFYAHSGRSCQPLLPRGQHPAATAVVRTGVAAVESCAVQLAPSQQAPPCASTAHWTVQVSPLKALTQRIVQCWDLAALAAVCGEQQQQLTPIHISAALTVCVKRLRQVQSRHYGAQLHSQQLSVFIASVLQVLLAKRHLCGGREVATVLWCLAKLQQTVPAAAVQQLLCQYVDVLPSSSCQATVMVLYALAKLGHQPGAASLDCLLHAVAKPHYEQAALDSRRSPYPGVARTLIAQHLKHNTVQQRQGPYQQQQQQLHHPLPNAVDKQQDAWELAQSIWALARLQQPGVAQTWLLPLLQLLYISSSQQQAGRLGGSPPSLLADGCHLCAMTLWSCASITRSWSLQPQADPQPLQGSSAQLQGQQRQQRLQAAVAHQAGLLLQAYEQHLDQLQPQSACMLLWSINRMGLAPSPSWCQGFYTATQRIVSRLSPSQCAALLCGAAYLPQRPPPTLCASCVSVLAPQLHSLPAAQLSQLLRACGRLRVRPPVQWVTALLEAFLARRQEHTPAAVSTLLHAASKVGYKPPAAAVSVLLEGVEQRLPAYRPHELSKLLMGCAALQLNLPDSLHRALLAALMVQLPASSPSAITLVLRALACRQSRQQQQQGEESQDVVQHAAACAGGPWQRGQQIQGAGSSYIHAHTWSRGIGVQPRQQHLLQRRQQLRVRSAWPAQISHSTPGTFSLQGPVDLQQQQQQLMSLGSAGSHSVSSWQQGQGSGGALVLSPRDISKLFSRAGVLLQSMQAVELCQCVWAAAWLQPALGMCWSQAITFVLPARVHELAAGDVCLLLWSLSRLRRSVRVEQRLLQRILWRSQQLMRAGCFSPRDLSAFVWSYWRVSAGQGSSMPASWVSAFCTAAASQLQGFNSRQLGVMLRACVLLQIPLKQQLLDSLVLLVEVRSAQLDRAELASILSSLAALQQQNVALCALRDWADDCARGKDAAARASNSSAPVDAQLSGVLKAVGPVDAQCSIGEAVGQSTVLQVC